jgi:glycerol kinase
MGEFIGAIDQGTTSTRFIVFDRAGRIVSIAQKEHAQHTPHPGWLEHDAAEILRNTRETAAEALIRANIGAADLHAVGITNQRETTLLWDRRTGVPLHPAIVWQDSRVDEAVASLSRAGHAPAIRASTGLPLARAHYRRHQCQPHPVDGSAHSGLVSRSAFSIRHPARVPAVNRLLLRHAG